VEWDPESLHLHLKHPRLDRGIVRSKFGGFLEVGGLENRHAATRQPHIVQGYRWHGFCFDCIWRFDISAQWSQRELTRSLGKRMLSWTIHTPRKS
jgi:hypothetical protein